MKNIFFLLFTLPVFCFGQQPGFRKLYSSDSTGAGFVDIIWDGEKLIASGQFLTSTAPNNAINGLLYMELDTNGNILFTDVYFYPNDAVAPGIGNSLFLSNNGIVYSMNQILYDSIVLLAFYQNSERINIKAIPIPGLQKWLYHCVDWNENLLLAGRRSNYQNDSEGMLIKSDANGNEIWRKYYGSPGLYCGIQEPYVIDDDNILLPGFKIYEGNGSVTSSWGRSWMILADSLGNIKSEWESPNNIENGASTRMLKMADGNWIYTSYEFIPMPGQIDDWGFRTKIICRDSNFNLVWYKYLSNFISKTNRIIDITPTADGNYLVVGKWLDYTMTSICKFSPGGEVVWSFNDPDAPVGFGDSFLGGVAELPGGSVVAAGYVEDYIANKTEGLIIKLDKNGCLDTLCSGWIGTEELEKVSKIKVYPNPASEVVRISNAIGEQIAVFDMAGRAVRTVPVQDTNQSIPVHDLPDGVYIITMQDKTLRVSYRIIKI